MFITTFKNAASKNEEVNKCYKHGKITGNTSQYLNHFRQ